MKFKDILYFISKQTPLKFNEQAPLEREPLIFNKESPFIMKLSCFNCFTKKGQGNDYKNTITKKLLEEEKVKNDYCEKLKNINDNNNNYIQKEFIIKVPYDEEKEKNNYIIKFTLKIEINNEKLKNKDNFIADNYIVYIIKSDGYTIGDNRKDVINKECDTIEEKVEFIKNKYHVIKAEKLSFFLNKEEILELHPNSTLISEGFWRFQILIGSSNENGIEYHKSYPFTTTTSKMFYRNGEGSYICKLFSICKDKNDKSNIYKNLDDIKLIEKHKYYSVHLIKGKDEKNNLEFDLNATSATQSHNEINKYFEDFNNYLEEHKNNDINFNENNFIKISNPNEYERKVNEKEQQINIKKNEKNQKKQQKEKQNIPDLNYNYMTIQELVNKNLEQQQQGTTSSNSTTSYNSTTLNLQNQPEINDVENNEQIDIRNNQYNIEENIRKIDSNSYSDCHYNSLDLLEDYKDNNRLTNYLNLDNKCFNQRKSGSNNSNSQTNLRNKRKGKERRGKAETEFNKNNGSSASSAYSNSIDNDENILQYKALKISIQNEDINELLDYIRTFTEFLTNLINNIHPMYLLDLVYSINKAKILPSIKEKIESKFLYYIIKNLNEETRELLVVHLDSYREIEENEKEDKQKLKYQQNFQQKECDECGECNGNSTALKLKIQQEAIEIKESGTIEDNTELRTSVDGSVCSDNNSYFQRESNNNKSESKTSLGKRKRRIKGKEKESDPIILKKLRKIKRRINNDKENEIDPQNSEPFLREMGKVVDSKNDFEDNVDYFGSSSSSTSVFSPSSSAALGKRKRRIKGKEKELDPIILKNILRKIERRNNGKENEMVPQNSEPFLREMGKVVDSKNDFKDNVDYFGSSSSSTSVSSPTSSTAFNSEEYDNNFKEDYYGRSSSSSSSSSPSSESTFTSTSLTFNSYEEYYDYKFLMDNIQRRGINNLLNYIMFNNCDLIYIINNIQPYYLLQLIDATNEAEILPEIFDRIEPIYLNDIIINLNDEPRVLLKVFLNFYNEVEKIIKDQFEV